MVTTILTFLMGGASKLLDFLKKLPRELYYVLGALVLLWFVHGQGVSSGTEKGKRSRDKEVATIIADRDTARRNSEALTAAIKKQGDTILRLSMEGKAAQDEAARAERRAAQSLAQVKGLRSRLEAEARQTGGKPGAALTKTQEDAWNALSQ